MTPGEKDNERLEHTEHKKGDDILSRLQRYKWEDPSAGGFSSPYQSTNCTQKNRETIVLDGCCRDIGSLGLAFVGVR